MVPVYPRVLTGRHRSRLARAQFPVHGANAAFLHSHVSIRDASSVYRVLSSFLSKHFSSRSISNKSPFR